jgi:hypothetical protein
MVSRDETTVGWECATADSMQATTVDSMQATTVGWECATMDSMQATTTLTMSRVSRELELDIPVVHQKLVVDVVVPPLRKGQICREYLLVMS